MGSPTARGARCEPSPSPVNAADSTQTTRQNRYDRKQSMRGDSGYQVVAGRVCLWNYHTKVGARSALTPESYPKRSPRSVTIVANSHTTPPTLCARTDGTPRDCTAANSLWRITTTPAANSSAIVSAASTYQSPTITKKPPCKFTRAWDCLCIYDHDDCKPGLCSATIQPNPSVGTTHAHPMAAV